ncbi:uncharacterized protein MELLADRAFT_70307 [Melampsora larici-populina 98AG31]|uniref:SGF29 C-terminal domain-containing protein n=1 Tax=Melampsora larici-populina (strain 98AG31 / pathotype 3-4-7) TaxID=747676 RepID=F4RK62_MELLP|nr:uncharacterized protein MELLADRAFT_62767 [Melampsora larici-populina 98AG31]XP_007419757.1 uncharacterized protein MELLADRAFT_70307 [Melampsora larici-populina 98AG31]EGF96974.1 hypothetical protein MELLADRAFT_70307 [Melampsora larici-populina 98AG31]EGG07238.1 hypothetical protein MELLADRAFT_62767 [Melampsora larici-populina 98AG31]
MGRRGQTQSNSSTNADAEAALQDRLPSSIDDPSPLTSDLEGLVGSIESLLKDTVEEEAILEVLLERLAILIALREAPPDPPQQGRAAKKRRIEHTSAEPMDSPASSSLLEPPVSSTSRTSSPAPLHLTQPLNPRSSQVVSRATTPILSDQPSTATTTTTTNRRDTRQGVNKSTRMAALRDQLPLLPGRLVAFKRPRKPSDAARSTDAEWIMARVVRCISNDKNRYEVEDVDVEGSSSEADTSNNVRKVSWNTTLKSIIPLPVVDKPETFPTVPLPPGTDVLGLYPDTTTFYLGKIESVPTQKSRKYKWEWNMWFNLVKSKSKL